MHGPDHPLGHTVADVGFCVPRLGEGVIESGAREEGVDLVGIQLGPAGVVLAVGHLLVDACHEGFPEVIGLDAGGLEDELKGAGAQDLIEQRDDVELFVVVSWEGSSSSSIRAIHAVRVEDAAYAVEVDIEKVQEFDKRGCPLKTRCPFAAERVVADPRREKVLAREDPWKREAILNNKSYC